MTKQSTDSGYFIGLDYFALERTELAKIRASMMAEHAKQLEEFDRQFDRLTQLESDVSALVARHAEPAKKSGVEKPTGKRSTPSRPVPSGKPWTPEEDARVLAADDAELRAIAAERNTKVSAIQKRRSILRRAAQVEESVGPEPIEESAQSESSSSEKPEIFEPASAPPASSIFDGYRAMERKPPERGTPVRGLMENGPEDRREYGRGFESGGRE